MNSKRRLVYAIISIFTGLLAEHVYASLLNTVLTPTDSNVIFSEAGGSIVDISFNGVFDYTSIGGNIEPYSGSFTYDTSIPPFSTSSPNPDVEIAFYKLTLVNFTLFGDSVTPLATTVQIHDGDGTYNDFFTFQVTFDVVDGDGIYIPATTNGLISMGLNAGAYPGTMFYSSDMPTDLNIFAAVSGPPTQFAQLSTHSITPIHYVSPTGAHVHPFTTWADAATNIQDAVDAAVDGDTVMVGDGIYDAGTRITPGYSCLNRLVITKDITVQSVNGSDFTIIVGAEATGGGNGPDAVRGVYMNNGLLIGFTVTNGYTLPYDVGHSLYDGSGGGVNMYGGSGIVSNCILIGNSAGSSGGGSHYGILHECDLMNNRAKWGAGMIYGTATDCIISGNVADNSGGGVYDSLLENCIITDNSAIWGGGTYISTAKNCTISRNTAENDGGGMDGGEAYNCLIVSNSSQYGGGLRTVIANNCTVIGNESETGGGMYYGTANNCIVWNNMADSGNDLFRTSVGYSCSPDLNHGVSGNTTNAPLFVDPANGDYRLLATSPCIDAGNNSFIFTTTDLAGMERIIDGDMDGTATVDMGAYEFNVQEIPVDIMVSTINLKSKGRTPVSIISTDDFDATTIDPASVRFAGASPVKYLMDDVDGDGDIDLKLHFMTADLDTDPADGEVMLMGQTYDGVLIVGVDIVKVISRPIK